MSYLIALLAVLFAATVRFGLDPWLAGRAHYLVFIVAVLIAAMFGGSFPAVFAATLAVLFVQVIDTTTQGQPSTGVEFATFAGSSAIVIWLVHLIMQLRVQSTRDEVEARLRGEDASERVQKLELLIDGIPGQALVMLDTKGRVAIWSRSAERLFGWSDEEAVGRAWDSFYASPGEADLALAREEGGLEREMAGLRADGGSFAAHVRFSALLDGQGRFRGYGQIVAASCAT